MTTVPRATVDSLLARYQALSDEMASGALDAQRTVALAKGLSEMERTVTLAQALLKAETDLEGVLELLVDETDADMRAMAEADAEALRSALPDLHLKLALALLPQDPSDAGNAILEVRAGTGGDEAALFAGDLFRMYTRFAALKGWKVDVLSVSESDVGGYREVVAEVTGQDVYKWLKFESGVHRVQRVPATEAAGRIHTSAATVAVLPEVAEVAYELNEADLRIDVYRASGAGGQHVNKTESAVRITHIPTGVVVAMQDDRSQHRNRAKAMQILRSKLFEAERQRVADERSSQRKLQVGSGDRSERIRTYNFPQGRLTDHRINLTLYSLDRLMEAEGLDAVFEALMRADEEERLAEAGL